MVKGWTISPFFTYQSGPGDTFAAASTARTGCQSFGEVTPPGGDSSNADRAVLAARYTGGNSLHYGIAPTTGAGSAGTTNGSGLNMFADPAGVLKEFRRCILGVDTSCGGYLAFRDPPIWNMDLTVAKDFKIKERVTIGASLQFANVFNHFAPGSPSTTITSPSSFGTITGQVTNQRQTEFGLRIAF